MASLTEAISEETVVISEYKDSLERFKKINKPKLVLGVLEALMEVNDISLMILKKTGIGKTVNGFRKSEGEVGQLARTLVTKWKDLAVDAIKSDKDKKAAQKSLIKQSQPPIDSSSINKQLTEHYKVGVKEEVKKEKVKLENPLTVAKSEVKDEKTCHQIAVPCLESTRIKKEKDVCATKDSSSKQKSKKRFKTERIKAEQSGNDSFESALLVNSSSSKTLKDLNKKRSKTCSIETEESQGEQLTTPVNKELSPSEAEEIRSEEDESVDPVKVHESISFTKIYEIGPVKSAPPPKLSEVSNNKGLPGTGGKPKKTIGLDQYKKLSNMKKEKDKESVKDVLSKNATVSSSAEFPVKLERVQDIKQEEHLLGEDSEQKCLANTEWHSSSGNKVDVARQLKSEKSNVNKSDTDALEDPPSLIRLQSDLNNFMKLINSKPTQISVKKESSPKTVDILPLVPTVKIELPEGHGVPRTVDTTQKSTDPPVMTRDSAYTKNSSDLHDLHMGNHSASYDRLHKDRSQSSLKSAPKLTVSNEFLDSANSDSKHLLNQIQHPENHGNLSSHKHSDGLSGPHLSNSCKLNCDKELHSSTKSERHKKSGKREKDRHSAKHSDRFDMSISSHIMDQWIRDQHHGSYDGKYNYSPSNSPSTQRGSDNHDRVKQSDRHNSSKHSNKRKMSPSSAHGDNESSEQKYTKQPSSSSSSKSERYNRDKKSDRHSFSEHSDNRRISSSSQKDDASSEEKPDRKYSSGKHKHSSSKSERHARSTKCDGDEKSDRHNSTKYSTIRKKSENSRNDDEYSESEGKSSKRSSSDKHKHISLKSEKSERSDRRSSTNYSDKHGRSVSDYRKSVEKLDGHRSSTSLDKHIRLSVETQGIDKLLGTQSAIKDSNMHPSISDNQDSDKKSARHSSSKSDYTLSKSDRHTSSDKHISKSGGSKARKSPAEDGNERQKSESSHKKHKHKSDKAHSTERHHKHSKNKADRHEAPKRKLSDAADDGIGQSFEDLMSNVSYPDQPKKKKSATLEQKIANKVAKAPLPQSYLDDLPELVAEYKPLPKISQGFTSRQDTAGANLDVTFSDIKAASRADAVYSGRRRGNATMLSLTDLCLIVLGNNIDDIGYVGGVPYSFLEPVLKKATPKQLLTVEDYNAEFTQESDPLWREHCARDFKGQKPDEFESYRELYLRKYEEREKKFEMLQSKIAAKEQQKLNDTRKSMVAYTMSSMPKPPREVRRQQAKYGTGSGSMESTSRAAAIIKHENTLKPFTSSRGSSGTRDHKASPVKIISVPPLMKKAKKFMSKLNR